MAPSLGAEETSFIKGGIQAKVKKQRESMGRGCTRPLAFFVEEDEASSCQVFAMNENGREAREK